MKSPIKLACENAPVGAFRILFLEEEGNIRHSPMPLKVCKAILSRQIDCKGRIQTKQENGKWKITHDHMGRKI